MVIDGVGGQAAGEEAADIALALIRGRLERQTGTVDRRIREAITLANNAIYRAAQSKEEWNGMACVLTVAVIENGRVTIGHVGDSRLYKIAGGKIQKITHDHSPVGEREDRGELTEQEAMRHPRRNEVYRDVGSEEHTPDDEDFIELSNISFEPGSALLLCSDGLSDAISSAEILKIVEENAGDRQATVHKLVDAANERGKDNVSAVLVEGEQFAATTEPARGSRRSEWAYLLCGIALGALLMYAGHLVLGKNTRAPRVLRVAAQSADFPTIAAAMQQARDADTIEVAAGEYREQVRLKEGVTLVSANAREAVITGGIVAEGIQRGRVAGFKLQGEGMAVRDANIDIEGLEIAGATLAGIEFSGASLGAVQGSYIHHNRGPGIVLKHPAAPIIQRNVLTENGKEPGKLKPGLEILSANRPSVSGNLFANNGAEAIWLAGPPDKDLVGQNFFAMDSQPGVKGKIRVISPGASSP